MCARSIRIGIIGDVGLDEAGQLRGAACIAKVTQGLGAQTALAALIPNDPRGDELMNQLQACGVDVSRAERSSRSSLALGDQIDVAGLFAMDAVLIAVSDARLHRFLADLPVHLAPNARIAGLIGDLACSSAPDALETVLRHDLAIGGGSDWKEILNAGISDDVAVMVQSAMTGANLRGAVLISDCGASIVTQQERFDGAANNAEAFIARGMLAFARREPWQSAFRALAST